MDLMKELDAIRREVESCFFASCFDMTSGLPIAMSTEQFAGESESISAAFGQMLDLIIKAQEEARNETVRTLLKGFKELTLETSLSTFMIILPAATADYAVVVGVPAHVKLGYARLVVSRHWDALSQALTEMM